MAPSINRSIDMVVVGCSAGGIEVLKRILSSLRTDFRPSLVIVQHISTGSAQSLSQFFASLCPLPVHEAEDQIPIENNKVYFAPAGYHLMVSDKKTFELSVEEPVRYSRPSINVLFETAADVYRDKLLGILLTGANDDGADGLRKIHLQQGVTIAQSPDEAEFAEMPNAAIRLHQPDFVLAIESVIRVLNDLK